MRLTLSLCSYPHKGNKVYRTLPDDLTLSRDITKITKMTTANTLFVGLAPSSPQMVCSFGDTGHLVMTHCCFIDPVPKLNLQQMRKGQDFQQKQTEKETCNEFFLEITKPSKENSEKSTGKTKLGFPLVLSSTWPF